MRHYFLISAACSFCALSCVLSASAGKIVLAGDDQTFAPLGFFPPNDGEQFALNVAAFFTGGQSGNFLVYSDHPALAGQDLANAMLAAGHSWTVSTAVPFDVPTLLTYDAVFVGGFNADVNTLLSYEAAGGNVYLAAGTGPEGPFGDYATEAAIWNVFLHPNNLVLASDENLECGSFGVNGTHPLVSGVSQLYQCNGQDVNVLDPNSATAMAEIVAMGSGGDPNVGYIGVSVSSSNPPLTNDECINATPVFVGMTSFSTMGATTGGPFEDPPCHTMASDVWFRFTSPCSGGALVELCGSNFDTVLAIYEGCPTESGQTLACNDDRCAQQSRVDFFAGAGLAYLIRVGGFEGTQGAGTLTITLDFSVPLGDVNSDGSVSLADLTILLAHFGVQEGAGFGDGDMDFDGDVDLSDLTLLLANFGSTCA